jgi:membrane associated rhomboid family serine protease
LIPIRDTIPSRRPPFVTWSLIAVDVAVFLYELTLDPQDLERLVYNFGLVPARFGVSQGRYWTLLTCV